MFHSWFQSIAKPIKCASVTILPLGADRVSGPKKVMDIGNILNQWVIDNLPKAYLPENVPGYMVVTSDGYENGLLGVVNWYINPDVPVSKVLPYVRYAIDTELTPLGINVAVTQDKSRMYEIPVFRLRIVSNKTSEHTRVPEMNVTNANFAALMKALGLPVEYEGRIHAQELLDRLANAYYNPALQPPEPSPLYPPFGEDPNERIHVINNPVRPEHIKELLAQLKQVADYAAGQNKPMVVWN